MSSFIYIYIYGGRGLKWCLQLLMLCVCVCASVWILKQTLPMEDIRRISIQIPYYPNVRNLCRYYSIFKSISFAMYNV